MLRSGKKIKGLENNEKADSLVQQALDHWSCVCKRTTNGQSYRATNGEHSYNMGHATLSLHFLLVLVSLDNLLTTERVNESFVKSQAGLRRHLSLALALV